MNPAVPERRIPRREPVAERELWSRATSWEVFEPECRSPAQMRLANAFCRYLELARTI